MMGNKSGRICLIYQIDFDEDKLEYRTIARDDKLEGTVESEEQLYDAVSELLDIHKTERLEAALKFFRFNNISGICPKSFPRTSLTIKLLSLLNLCVGGETGTEIKHFPYEGGILEQSNIFVQAYYIWCDEYSKFIKLLRQKSKVKDNNETGR